MPLFDCENEEVRGLRFTPAATKGQFNVSGNYWLKSIGGGSMKRVGVLEGMIVINRNGRWNLIDPRPAVKIVGNHPAQLEAPPGSSRNIWPELGITGFTKSDIELAIEEALRSYSGHVAAGGGGNRKRRKYSKRRKRKSSKRKRKTKRKRKSSKRKRKSRRRR